MFRKELLITLAFALGVFVIVALLASLGVRKVQTEGRSLARDTLPGDSDRGCGPVQAADITNDPWAV